jgi:hypothetical protein
MKAGWFSFNNDDYNVDDDIKSDDSARAQNEVDPLFHRRRPYTAQRGDPS